MSWGFSMCLNIKVTCFSLLIIKERFRVIFDWIYREESAEKVLIELDSAKFVPEL